MKNSNHKTFKLIVSALLLFFIVQSNLSVYNAQSLGLNAADQKIDNIKFSMANFGFVPFGKTMSGELVTSPGFSDECELNQGSQINADGKNNTILENFFMIIPRGNCKFVQKALNSQKLGAKMAIIVDNKNYSEPFIMADNGEGYKVKIPTIFISHEDGENLIKAINKVQNKREKLIVKVLFENRKTEKITLKLFLQANNRRSYKLVSDFQSFYQKVSSYVDLKLIYQNQQCSYCVEEDCFFKDQYCSYGYITQQGANGKQILSQQIREMIIYQKHPTKWWGWMSYFGEECSKISEFKQCSQSGMKKMGIDISQIGKAYNDSFQENGDNKYLKASKQSLELAGVFKYPSVSINDYNIKGSISAQYLFDDICNTLNNPPADCSKYVNETVVVTYVKEYWLLVIFIVIIGFAIFSGLFILYKRYMKKRMSADMKNRVDDMVSKYIEFYSERQGRN